MTRPHPLRGRIPAMWGPCSTLRVATIRYGDYVEQLTYFLFLKMADERSRPPYNQRSPVLVGYDWPRIAPSLALPARGRGSF
mgnify:CR=1 FL=1